MSAHDANTEHHQPSSLSEENLQVHDQVYENKSGDTNYVHHIIATEIYHNWNVAMEDSPYTEQQRQLQQQQQQQQQWSHYHQQQDQAHEQTWPVYEAYDGTTCTTTSGEIIFDRLLPSSPRSDRDPVQRFAYLDAANSPYPARDHSDLQDLKVAVGSKEAIEVRDRAAETAAGETMRAKREREDMRLRSRRRRQGRDGAAGPAL